MKIWTLLTLMGFAALAHGAEMYRWVDEKGTVNYTPYPPPANVKKVEQKKLGGNASAAEAQTSDTPYSSNPDARPPRTKYFSPASDERRSSRANAAST